MDWMHNKYASDYKAKYKNLTEGIERLYTALGIVRDIPDIPATRRYDLDRGKTIKLGDSK